MKDNKTTAPAAAESCLALSYRGALPEILRAIATELDAKRAFADHFITKATNDSFELSAFISFTPK